MAALPPAPAALHGLAPADVMTRDDLALRAARHRWKRRPASALTVDGVLPLRASPTAAKISGKPQVMRFQTETLVVEESSHHLQRAARCEDTSANRYARTIYRECIIEAMPLSKQLAVIERLLEAQPLLQGTPQEALRALAARAELRRGERYHTLYTAGTEARPVEASVDAAGAGYAYIILHGEVEAVEEAGRSKDEPVQTRADRYGCGELCGAEPLLVPPRVHPSDPSIPRTQSCKWTTAGAALALPLAALAAVRLSGAATRRLQTALCAQLLSPLLPGTDERAPSWASLLELASRASLSRRFAGEMLCEAGQPADAMVFLVRGSVELSEPPPRTAAGPSLDGRRASLRRPSAAHPIEPPAPLNTHMRLKPGPLDSHLVLAETVHELNARVATNQRERSALVLSIPAQWSRLILNRQPDLRQSLEFHSHEARIHQSTDKKLSASHASRDTLTPSLGAGALGASPSASNFEGWHRARAAEQARSALLDLPGGVRRHKDDPSWTYMIAQMDSFGTKYSRQNRGSTVAKLGASASTPSLHSRGGGAGRGGGGTSTADEAYEAVLRRASSGLMG